MLRLGRFTCGTASEPISSVDAARVPLDTTNTEPPGSADMFGAIFAMDWSPGVFGMKLPPGAIVPEFTTNCAAAKPKGFWPGIFKHACLAFKGGFVQVPGMPVVSMLHKYWLAHKLGPRGNRWKPVALECG